MYRSLNAMTVGGARLYVHFHDIVATARQRNAQAGIGGFLMFDRSRFHQILEGPAERVDVLFARIRDDNRHRDIECLAREPVDTRRFGQWSMGSFLAGGGDHPILRRHGLQPLTALDYEPFLEFALDFAQEHDPV